MYERNLIIHAGWLINGSGQATKGYMKIGLQNGIIHSIGKLKKPLPHEPEAAGSVLDFSDCTVLPALIDCHSHLSLPEAPSQEKPGSGSIAAEPAENR